MNEFLKFIDEKRRSFPMHIEITYSKICDWCIYVYKKGCAKDFPNSEHDGEDVVICYVQNCDMELAFAMAQVEVKEWLLDNNDGY